MVLEQVIKTDEPKKVKSIIEGMTENFCCKDFYAYLEKCKLEEKFLSPFEKAFYKNLLENLTKLLITMQYENNYKKMEKEEIVNRFLKEGVSGYNDCCDDELIDCVNYINSNETTNMLIKSYMLETLENTLKSEEQLQAEKRMEEKARLEEEKKSFEQKILDINSKLSNF